MARETLALDPVEVAPNRTELSLDSVGGPIRVRAEGVDWGDHEIAGYMAERDRGEAAVAYRVPNRKVTIPLVLSNTGAVSFAAAQGQLQQKVALLQREGGWLRRRTRDGRTLFADVVNATLGMGGGTFQARNDLDPDVSLVLECIPDFYGAEVALSAASELSDPDLQVVRTGIGGDWPGRLRWAVTDLQGQDRLGVFGGIRSRYYDPAATARLAYEAEAMTPLDVAAAGAVTGASGGQAVSHANLGAGSWTPVLSTDLLSGGPLTHQGSYRVVARCSSPNGQSVSARFVWSVGDLASPLSNKAWTFPGANNFYLADLGQVRLDRGPVGTHRWQGQVQAQGVAGGEDITIDRLYLVPLDEAAFFLSAPLDMAPGKVPYSARDEFDQTAGNLAGKTAPIGGTWAGAGDPDDFVVDATTASLTRTAVSDSGAGAFESGRIALAGTGTTTSVASQVDISRDMATFNINTWRGLVARYVDINNMVVVTTNDRFIVGTKYTIGPWIEVWKRVGGTWTRIAQGPFPNPTNLTTLRAYIAASGKFIVWTVNGDTASFNCAGQDTDLATGGALASGRNGLVDRNVSTTAATRTYDNHKVWVPATDAVIFAGRYCEVRTDGVFRTDPAGVGASPVARHIGDLPRLPPAGMEGRSVETIVVGSRGDLDQLPDSGIDDIQGQLFYRPSWMFVPGP